MTDDERPGPDDPPPLLGTWTNLYAVVLAVLAAQVAVYSWLTWTFS